FFFFQAEDGIRDFHVTGVQTCALPISIERLGRRVLTGFVSGAMILGAVLLLIHDRNRAGYGFLALGLFATVAHNLLEWIRAARRSEERRVGKECRARGWPGVLKKDRYI